MILTPDYHCFEGQLGSADIHLTALMVRVEVGEVVRCESRRHYLELLLMMLLMMVMAMVCEQLFWFQVRRGVR